MTYVKLELFLVILVISTIIATLVDGRWMIYQLFFFLVSIVISFSWLNVILIHYGLVKHEPDEEIEKYKQKKYFASINIYSEKIKPEDDPTITSQLIITLFLIFTASMLCIIMGYWIYDGYIETIINDKDIVLLGGWVGTAIAVTRLAIFIKANKYNNVSPPAKSQCD